MNAYLLHQNAVLVAMKHSMKIEDGAVHTEREGAYYIECTYLEVEQTGHKTRESFMSSMWANSRTADPLVRALMTRRVITNDIIIFDDFDVWVVVVGIFFTRGGSTAEIPKFKRRPDLKEWARKTIHQIKRGELDRKK